MLFLHASKHSSSWCRLLVATAALNCNTATIAKAWTPPCIPQKTISQAIPESRSGSSSSMVFNMMRTRGLEQRREGATPTEGGMTLYLKAAEDGISVGDCPFAHFVRLVLEEKGLEYELRPLTPENKPNWLIEHYQGKMPALRHRKECYTESGTIVEYLEFFFSGNEDGSSSSLKPKSVIDDTLLEGFFPAVAQYFKAKEGDDNEKLDHLKGKLAIINDHLADGRQFLDGDAFTVLDCRLLPQLYHLHIGVEGFKSGVPDIKLDYPHVEAYYVRGTSRPSFAATVYSKETVLWGWGNARK